MVIISDDFVFRTVEFIFRYLQERGSPLPFPLACVARVAKLKTTVLIAAVLHIPPSVAHS